MLVLCNELEKTPDGRVIVYCASNGHGFASLHRVVEHVYLIVVHVSDHCVVVHSYILCVGLTIFTALSLRALLPVHSQIVAQTSLCDVNADSTHVLAAIPASSSWPTTTVGKGTNGSTQCNCCRTLTTTS